MNKLITQEQVQVITNWLLNSILPSVDVQKVVSILVSLPPEKKEEVVPAEPAKI